MNKIWTFIIIISIVFGLINNKIPEMSNTLFNVPKETLKLLLQIGSSLIIYNGLFQIAVDARIISKISRIIVKPVSKLFIVDKETLDLICASIIANLLGLGPANMAIALKIIDRLNNTSFFSSKNRYNLTMYLLLNVSSLCVLPMTLIAFREMFKAKVNIAFIPMLFLGSFITTIIAIILVKVFEKR